MSKIVQCQKQIFAAKKKKIFDYFRLFSIIQNKENGVESVPAFSTSLD
jgi:hypothetical protein